MTMHAPGSKYEILESRVSQHLAIQDLTPVIPGVQPVDVGQLRGALTRARVQGFQMQARADGLFGWSGDGSLCLPDGGLDAYQRRQDHAMLEEFRRRDSKIGENTQRLYREWVEERLDGMTPEQRADAASGYLPGGPGGFPRDFEFTRTKIWEEERQPLTGLTLFPQDSSVPLGARTHTARRRLGRGVARIFRGSSFVPRVNLGFLEQTFGVIYIVCGVGQNHFEQLSMDFAGIASHQENLRTAKRAVEERVNEVVWRGDTASKVYGVLNYPDLAKQELPLAYDDSPGSPLDLGNYTREDLVLQLMDLGSTPRIRSGTRFKPTRLAVSPAMMSFLTGRRHINTGGPDSSMLKYFIDNNPLQIKNIDEAPELSGIGPNGEDGILYFADDTDTMHNVMIQSPTTLPVYQSGPFDQLTVVYAAVGGMVMGNHGNCILGLAQVKAF